MRGIRRRYENVSLVRLHLMTVCRQKVGADRTAGWFSAIAGERQSVAESLKKLSSVYHVDNGCFISPRN
jgi:hypothetical protein